LALADLDDNVRLQALNVAQANGFHLAVDAIEMLLSMDPSEIVRPALETLSLNPDVDPHRMHALLLNQANRDPSPMVRELAAALLNAFSSPPQSYTATTKACPASTVSEAISTGWSLSRCLTAAVFPVLPWYSEPESRLLPSCRSAPMCRPRPPDAHPLQPSHSLCRQSLCRS
jgi:hypothetical protein